MKSARGQMTLDSEALSRSVGFDMIQIETSRRPWPDIWVRLLYHAPGNEGILQIVRGKRSLFEGATPHE